MLNRYRVVLEEKKGFATVFMLGFMAIILVFALGVAVVNFAEVSALTSQDQNLTAAVVSRANAYVGTLNETVKSGTAAVPVLAAETDARTDLITSIVSVTPSKDALSQVLVIKSSSISGVFHLTRSVTVYDTPVTHVTSFDANGNPVWTLSSEPNQFNIWAVSLGSVRALTAAELLGASKAQLVWSTSTAVSGIDTAGHLWTWGSNSHGQIGNGTVTDVATPVEILPSTKFRSVASEDGSTFAIDSTGQLWAWGNNNSGQLGLGGTTDWHTPQLVNATLWQTVATSDGSTFAIDSLGQVWGWGDNTGGRLATASSATTVTSPSLLGTTGSFTDVVTASGSTYALRMSGKILAWGSNTSGQLGLGTTAPTVVSPTEVPGGTLYDAISAGGGNVAAIDSAGGLWSWGAAGRVGNASASAALSPVHIDTALTFVEAAVGQDADYALSSSGHLLVWGKNANGVFGNGTTSDALTPVAVLPSIQFSAVYANPTGIASAAIDSDGGQWSFGHAGSGLWDSGYTADPDSALKMPFPDAFGKEGF
jgi:hypothetical protein